VREAGSARILRAERVALPRVRLARRRHHPQTRAQPVERRRVELAHVEIRDGSARAEIARVDVCRDVVNVKGAGDLRTRSRGVEGVVKAAYSREELEGHVVPPWWASYVFLGGKGHVVPPGRASHVVLGQVRHVSYRAPYPHTALGLRRDLEPLLLDRRPNQF
jgi:hypothetical protein